MNPIKRFQNGIISWFVTWPQRQPWKDAPALLAFLLGLAFIWAVFFWDPMVVRSHYGRVMNSAFGKGDYQTALVASQRLLALSPSWRNQTLFSMALAHQGLGHQDKALALLQEVAPADRPVFAPAHLYVANSLLRQPDASRRFLPLILAQFKQALALEPDSIEANEGLGAIYSSQKEWALAEKCFSAIIKKKPEHMLLLARMARERSNEKAAENWTHDALVHFQKAVEKSASDNSKNRIPYLEALMMRNEFGKAKAVLDEGRKLSGDAPYKPVAGLVCAGLARELAAKETDNLDARIKLLREGMDANPKDLSLLALLPGLSERDGIESGTAGDRILKMVDEKDAWPPLFFAAAKISWKRQDTAGMKTYLARACEAFPKALPMANNLASVINRNGRKEDLPFALEMMDYAVEQDSSQPLFRLNRGLVLLYSAKPQDALPDFHFAFEHLEDKSPAHRALSEAYQAMGMSNLAQKHRPLANPAARDSTSPTPDGGTGKMAN